MCEVICVDSHPPFPSQSLKLIFFFDEDGIFSDASRTTDVLVSKNLDTHISNQKGEMVVGKKLSKNPELTQFRTIYSSYLRKKP